MSTTTDDLRAGFADPPTGSAPMMRWWWFGPSVERTEIDRELVVMARAGIAGVEVAYVYPLSPDSDEFGSPEFLANLRYAAEAARALDLRFDLTLGSGWSFGGPHITAEHAARKLVWEQREIGPGALTVPVVPRWPGDELIAAYLGAGSLQETPDELSGLPVVDGSIEIPAGAGPRLVLLAYAQQTGQNVKRAALGAEGLVLDHYSAAAARSHLRHVGDRLLEAVPAHLIGSVFCDSLEVYGSDWTPGLLAEFESRRGYDPRPNLYRLVVDGPDAARLRADYHRTLAELYEDHFVAVFQQWAAEHGVPFRIQGYGTPPAMISSYRRADLFEGEGWGWTELTQTRWAASAAHLYGRDVVSSETWTWVHSPSYRATPLDLQGEAHEHLLAGINQFVGHGWPYSPTATAGIGQFFYAAGALDDRNPWWPAMAPLMQYLTRLCWLMRQGVPVADVLVYVPAEDVFARMGTATGGSLDAWREARLVIGDDLIRILRQGGWDFDLVDDGALEVLPSGPLRPVIIPRATALSPAVQAWFERYVTAGGTVITVDAPVEIAGATGCGIAGLAAALSAECPPDVLLQPSVPDIGVVHRQTPDADVYLVINTGPSVRSVTLTPRTARGWYEEWDAHIGRVIRAGRPQTGIDLRLHPYQATVIVSSDVEPVAPATTAEGDHGQSRSVPLRDGWQVQYADRDAGAEVDLPHVWETDPERASFSGSATYRTTADLPELKSSLRIHLDLGEATALGVDTTEPGGLLGHSFRAAIDPPIGVIVEVRVNGVDCGVVWAPPYVLDVTRAARSGPNQVEIVVSNTASNQLAADERISAIVAASERRHGRRFRMQELHRAMSGVRSGLLDVPALVLTD
jgi:hypothetical protein